MLTTPLPISSWQTLLISPGTFSPTLDQALYSQHSTQHSYHQSIRFDMQGKCNYHSWNRLFLFSFPEGRDQILPLFVSAIALNSIHDPGWCSLNCCKWYCVGRHWGWLPYYGVKTITTSSQIAVRRSLQIPVVWFGLVSSRRNHVYTIRDSWLKRNKKYFWKHWYTLILLTNSFLLSSKYSHLSTFILSMLSRRSIIYVVLNKVNLCIRYLHFLKALELRILVANISYFPEDKMRGKWITSKSTYLG